MLLGFGIGKLKGFNSDYYGFRKSLEEILDGRTPEALILGTGGASKAVQTVLQDIELRYTPGVQKLNRRPPSAMTRLRIWPGIISSSIPPHSECLQM